MTVSVLRTIILYILLVVAMRIMGKRQLGELQPSELVITLLLSDLAAVPMQETGLPLLNGVLPILVLVALEVLVSCVLLKSPALSRLVTGTPLPIIRDGQVDRHVMKRLRITMEDLAETLRQQDIFDLQQVQYAIAETNGHISAYCYPAYQTPTKQDLDVTGPDTGMPVVVVSDGKPSAWGMSLCGVDDAWLKKTLKKHHCRLEQVFLLTATKTGQHYLLTEQDVQKGETP